MVDLYRDIDWDEYLEDPELDVDFFDFMKDIQATCRNLQSSDELRDQNVKKPEVDTTYSNFLLAIGLPRVPQDKVVKIKTFFVKLILPKLKLNENFVDIDVEYVEGDKLSTGNAILQFQNPDFARNAQEKLHNFKLDAKHTISAVTFDKFDDILNEHDATDEIKILQREELLDHFTDDFNRDQMTVLVSNDGNFNKASFEHYWHNDVEGNVQMIKRQDRIKASNIMYSPSSAYLAAIHERGFSLYGGKKMEEVNQFTHYGVKQLKFSSNDTYVASYNGVNNAVNGKQNIIVWDLVTGRKLRHLTCHDENVFKYFDWSFDEKYCASLVRREESNFLCVYNADTMSMTVNKDKKKLPVQAEDPQMFYWAHEKNEILFICYNPREGSEKSAAGIVQVPSGSILNWINLDFRIYQCKAQWERRDRYIILYFDMEFKKREHVIQFGIPDYRRMKIDVKVLTLSEMARPYIANVSISGTARGFAMFWSKNDKDVNYTCVYYRAKYSSRKKIVETKQSMVLEQCGFKDIEWSNIDNLFFLKQRGAIAIGHFDDVFSKKPDNFTGILKEVNVGSQAVLKYDVTGRFVLIFEPNINKFSVYNSFGLLRFFKTFKGGREVTFREVPPVPLDTKIEKQILTSENTNNMKKLIDKYAKADKVRRDKYKDFERTQKKKREEKFFSRMKAATKIWDETKKERVALFGSETVSDAILVYYVDKKEEYDRKAF